jgi:hypothetical protein
MIPDLSIICDAPRCVRGLVRNASEWPEACPFCGGRGSVSFRSVCKRIGEHDSTVRRVLKPKSRMRPKVAARICNKLVELYEPPKTKQKELFY